MDSRPLATWIIEASFIPPAAQRDWRELTRYRTTLVEERARIVNRLQKTLEDTNLKLGDVVTDILGKSARAILDARLSGQSDPVLLADLARGRLKAKRAELEQALVGTLKPHHRFLLKEHLAHIDTLDQAMVRVGAEIAVHMRPLEQAEASETPADEAAQTKEQTLTWGQAIVLHGTHPRDQSAGRRGHPRRDWHPDAPLS